MPKRRVLVTAGASGIGREIVRAFVAQGAVAFVCDIDQAALNTLSGELAEVENWPLRRFQTTGRRANDS